jgi:hypothetical protein
VRCCVCGIACSVETRIALEYIGAVVALAQATEESAGAEIFEVMRLPLTSKDAACCHTYGCT